MSTGSGARGCGLGSDAVERIVGVGLTAAGESVACRPALGIVKVGGSIIGPWPVHAGEATGTAGYAIGGEVGIGGGAERIGR